MGNTAMSDGDRASVEEQRMSGLPAALPLFKDHSGIRTPGHPAGRRTIAR